MKGVMTHLLQIVRKWSVFNIYDPNGNMAKGWKWVTQFLFSPFPISISIYTSSSFFFNLSDMNAVIVKPDLTSRRFWSLTQPGDDRKRGERRKNDESMYNIYWLKTSRELREWHFDQASNILSHYSQSWYLKTRNELLNGKPIVSVHRPNKKWRFYLTFHKRHGNLGKERKLNLLTRADWLIWVGLKNKCALIFILSLTLFHHSLKAQVHELLLTW